MKNWQIIVLFHACWFTIIYLILRIDGKANKVLERLKELEKKIESGKRN
jgi:hypothetical protein